MGLSCPKGVPNPACSPPLPAGCQRMGPGHPQGGWEALPPPSSHPQRGQGGQGAAGRSQDPPRALMGMTGCWLCSALGTRGTWQGGLVLERHTLRGKGDMQGRAWQEDRGTHRGHKEAEEDREQGGHGDAQRTQEWGQRTWRGNLGHLDTQRCCGTTGDVGAHSGERLEGTSDALRVHESGQEGNMARVRAVRSSEGAVTVATPGAQNRIVTTGHRDSTQGGYKVPEPYLCQDWQRAGRGCAGQAGDSAGTPVTPAAPRGG